MTPHQQGEIMTEPGFTDASSPTGRREYQPLLDYGVFGPDSVAWRVWTYPTTPTVAISRAVVVEELDPFLTATVNATSRIYNQPRVRLERTIHYFATIAIGDSLSAAKAAETLTKVHAHAGCVEPVSGVWSDPNNPDQQLWILVTGWHSVLYAYELYGPGKLSESDERRYWADCAKAAEFQTIDPAAVPRTRDEVRDYFQRMRPRLAASEATQHAMQHLMDAEVFLPDLPAALAPLKWPARFLLRAGVIRMLPRWQRDLANTHQSAAVDWLIRPILRVGMSVLARPKRHARPAVPQPVDRAAGRTGAAGHRTGHRGDRHAGRGVRAPRHRDAEGTLRTVQDGSGDRHARAFGSGDRHAGERRTPAAAGLTRPARLTGI